ASGPGVRLVRHNKFGQVFVGRRINGGNERSAGASILEVILSIEPVREARRPLCYGYGHARTQLMGCMEYFRASV
ncbi:unnamed protein product, partial [Brassica oleracea var. botrytis]